MAIYAVQGGVICVVLLFVVKDALNISPISNEILLLLLRGPPENVPEV